jgi:hypothetical protein
MSRLRLFELGYSRNLSHGDILTETTQNQGQNLPLAEQTATTKCSVVSGLGYPNGREVTSPEPTGWLVVTRDITHIEKQVSRETSR